MKLYHSRGDLWRETITLTPPHYKGDAARRFNVEHVFEGHVEVPHPMADSVLLDKVDFVTKFSILEIGQVMDTKIVIRGSVQRDVDMACAHITGRYQDVRCSAAKRHRPNPSLERCEQRAQHLVTAPRHVTAALYPRPSYVDTTHKQNDESSNTC